VQTKPPSRTFGVSGLKVPPVSLGLMVRDCSPGPEFESVRQTILRAVELGLTSIDLATGYGGGAVETAVGAVLKSDLSARRDQLVLATKAGWADGSRKTLVQSLERSLRQLGVESVDLYYHHAPDPTTPPEETVAAMEQLVRQGKTLYAGISNYSLAESIRIGFLFKQAGVACVAHQCNYNLLNRWVEDGLLDALPALGMGAAVFTAVAQGLLSDATAEAGRPRAGSRAEKTLDAIAAGVPEGERAYGVYPRGTDVRSHVMETAKRLHGIARRRGQSLEQLAIAWTLRHPAVTTAIVGCSSPEQVEAAHGAMSGPPLSKEDLADVANVIPPRPGMP
jgi:L-glyceraldehyde 3-phosphate reductase